MWIAVGGTPASVVRAGALGLPLTIAIIGGQPERFVPLVELYRRRRARRATGAAAGHQHACLGRRRPVRVRALVHGDDGPDRPRARLAADDAAAVRALRSPRGALTVGEPQELIEKILFHHELFGHQRYLAHMSLGAVEHRDVLRSIERFATEVAPDVRAELAPPGGRVTELGERLAVRTLELIDIPSESRDEAGWSPTCVGGRRTDLGDTCLLVDRGAPVLLAGHLDTVPAQGNLPGRIDGGRVHGLGASDMKGALAVMIELALAGAPFDLLFFGREELPASGEHARAAAGAPPARLRAGGDDGADRQRAARGLPREHERHVDVPRRLRALRAAVGRRQRHPRGGPRDRRVRRAGARGARVRRPVVLRGRVGHAGSPAGSPRTSSPTASTAT